MIPNSRIGWWGSMRAATFDPEVVALLREIVEDPNSTLTRIPTERLERWIPRAEDMILPSGSYLTKAEKHLAQAYREEAAWVLLHACMERMTSKSFLIFATSSIEPNLLRRNARYMGIHFGLEIPLLGRLDETAPEPLPTQLASTALMLVPSDAARIVLACAYHHEGAHSTALGLLNTILHQGSASIARSMAWESCGSVYSSQESYRQAYDCYDRACRMTPNRCNPHVWMFAMALQLGDHEATLRAANLLNAHPRNAAQLNDLASRLRNSRSASQWTPTSVCRNLIQSIGDQLPETTRGLCAAFA